MEKQQPTNEEKRGPGRPRKEEGIVLSAKEQKLVAELAGEETIRKGAEKERDELRKKLEVSEARRKAENPVDKTALEREIRRYVKRSGGYRKGLPQAKKDLCDALLKDRLELGCDLTDKKGDQLVKWDTDVFVEGIDNPSVASYTYDPMTKKVVSTR